MPSATSVVARSYPDRIIGIDNQLPWHLGTDLKNFKSLTQGHAIIMGRKTYESIGRPLPNRMNIILSREVVDDTEDLKWAPNPEIALLLADFYSICLGKLEFFVIGGEHIYDILYKYINKIFLTDVFCGNINGDAKFDYDFDISEWYFKFEREYQISPVDDHPFRVSCLLRRKPVHRERSFKEFMKRGSEFEREWESFLSLQSQVDENAENGEKQLNLI